MKLRILSDLHLEFGLISPPAVKADVVVLAGDIGIGHKGIRWAAKTFADTPVVYVAGNHEFYGSNYEVTTALLRRPWGRQVHFLENDAVEISGVRFLGCTLWTDFQLFGAAARDKAMSQADAVMSDYDSVSIGRKKEKRKLSPADTARLHAASRCWLAEELRKPFPGPTVVVTHHAPHPLSVAPEFADDLVTAAYVSDVSAVMGPSRLWIHGHTHVSLDYMVAGTRVICNPRGYYRKDWNADFDPGLVIEV